MKNTNGLLHIHAYWAHLETKLGNDITAARGVWENFLKTWSDNVYLNPLVIKCFCYVLFILSISTYFFIYLCSGSMLEAWTGYIAMEVELGHINEARSIYKRCYSKRFSGTGSEVYQASLISRNIATLFFNVKCNTIMFNHKFVVRWGALLQHNSLVCCTVCKIKLVLEGF
jgi:hypothetical protein